MERQTDTDTDTDTAIETVFVCMCVRVWRLTRATHLQPLIAAAGEDALTMFAQVIALSSALQVGVRVVHLDRSAGPLNHHDFPDGQPPSVHLLYRPGHYDLIYA